MEIFNTWKYETKTFELTNLGIRVMFFTKISRRSRSQRFKNDESENCVYIEDKDNIL